MQVEARGPATTATAVTSTSALVVSMLDRYVFHGQTPPELYAWLQLVVPAALGTLSAEWAQRRAARQAQASQSRTQA